MVDDKGALFNFTADAAMNRKEITSAKDKKAPVCFIPTNCLMAFFYPVCGNCGHIVDAKTSCCDKCHSILDWQKQGLLKKPHWFLASLRTALAFFCGSFAAKYFFNW